MPEDKKPWEVNYDSTENKKPWEVDYNESEVKKKDLSQQDSETPSEPLSKSGEESENTIFRDIEAGASKDKFPIYKMPEDSDTILKGHVDKMKFIQNKLQETPQFVDQENQAPGMIQDGVNVSVSDNTFIPKDNPEFKVLQEEGALTFTNARKAFKANYLENNPEVVSDLQSNDSEKVESANKKIYKAFSENEDIGYAAKKELEGEDSSFLEVTQSGISVNPTALESMYDSFKEGMDERDFNVSMAKELAFAEDSEAKTILELEYERSLEESYDIHKPESGMVSAEGLSKMAGTQAVPIVSAVGLGLLPGVGKPASMLYSGMDAAATSYGAAKRGVYIQARNEGRSEAEAFKIASKEAKVQAATGFVEGVAGAGTVKIAGKPLKKFTEKFASKKLKPLIDAARLGVSDMGLDAGVAAVAQTVNNASSMTQGLNVNLFDGVPEEMLGEIIFSAGMKIPSGVKTVAEYKQYVNELPPKDQQKIFNEVIDNSENLENKLTLDRANAYLDVSKKDAESRGDKEAVSTIENNPKEALTVEVERLKKIEAALTNESSKKEVGDNIKALDLMINSLGSIEVETANSVESFSSKSFEDKINNPKFIKAVGDGDIDVSIDNDEKSQEALDVKVKEYHAKAKEEVEAKDVKEVKVEKKKESPVLKEEKPSSKEEGRQFAIDAVVTGQIQPRSETKASDTKLREDFGMTRKDINSAIQNIKDVADGKKKKHSKPAENLLAKLEEAHEKGAIPTIFNTGGKTERPGEVKIDVVKKGIAEAKKNPTETKSDKDQEASSEWNEWLDDPEGWEGDNVFNSSKGSGIVEWKGEPLPNRRLKNAVAEYNKTKDAEKSLDIIKDTDWFDGLSTEKQKAFEADFKKSVGSETKGIDIEKKLSGEINSLKQEQRYRRAEKSFEEVSTSKLIKMEKNHETKKGRGYSNITTELYRRQNNPDRKHSKVSDSDLKSTIAEKSELKSTINPFIRKKARSLIKEKIKTIKSSLTKGEKIGRDKIKEVQKSLSDYVDGVVGGLPISEAKEKVLRHIIGQVDAKNYDKIIDRVDKIVKVAVETQRKSNIKKISDIVSKRKSILRKKGKMWVAKVPVSVLDYIRGFNMSDLRDMSAQEVAEVHQGLKDMLIEGRQETKAFERSIAAKNRREKATPFVELNKGGVKKTVDGYDAVAEVLGTNNSAVIVDGQLVESVSALKDLTKDNPNASFDNVPVYDIEVKKIAEYNDKSSKRKYYEWLNPFTAKQNLFNSMLPLIKGSKAMRGVIKGLNDKVNDAYFNMNEDKQVKLKDYKDKVGDIFAKKLSTKRKFYAAFISKKDVTIKANRAANRLGSYAEVKPQKGFEAPPTNSMIVNWYNLDQTDLGKKGLEKTDVNMKDINEYMNRPENSDLKEYADYLLNDFYPNLKSEYEPTYFDMTGDKFPEGVYYPAFADKSETDHIDNQGIFDKDGNVSVMSAVAGNLKQRVKHTQPVNLTVGAHEVAVNYINTMERSKHFIPVGKSVNNIFNKAAIPDMIDKMGVGAFESMMDHLTIAVTGTNPLVGKKIKFQKGIDNLMGLQVFGALAFKMASIPKQVTSFTHFSTADGVRLHEWIAGFAPTTKNEREVAKRIMSSNYVKDRFKGRSIDIEASKLIDPTSTKKAKRAISTATTIGMLPISIGDILGVTIGGTPLAVATYRQGIKKGLSHEEAYDAAYKKFVTESESAQQSTRESEVSHMQRDNVGRLFSAFTTSQTQTTNKMVGAAKVLFSKSELTDREIGENLYKMMYYAGANISFAMVANGFIKEAYNYAFEDGNEDELKKGAYNTLMDNTQSILNGTGIHGIVGNWIINLLRDDEWKNNIPIMQQIGNVGGSAVGLVNLFSEGEDWDDLTEAEKEAIWNGLPFRSIRKQLKNFKMAKDGEKSLGDAIMNYKSEEEKKGFKPKDDKIYESIFDKSYTPSKKSPIEQKKAEINKKKKAIVGDRKKTNK
jgi:hypothetical protein